MARILVVIFVTFVVVQAAHKHHPKFQKLVENYEASNIKKVACSPDNEQIRTDFIERSKCGAPKEVFVYLELQAAHEQVSPSAVWVKRCVGTCDHTGFGSRCVPLTKEIREIPIRVYNVKTNKESCSMYEVEEHTSCGCCAGAPSSCAPPRVYDPRKCACRCPNRKEKRLCRSKRNQIMRWNPSKCACEERLRIR